MGWNDEGAAGLMSLGDRLGLLKPKDPEGIPREYAAGSQYQDNVQSLRGDDSAAQQANPGAYTGGALAGSVPSALASAGLGGGSAAARLATSGLTGGALGAVSGAGYADRGNTLRGAAEGAALGGAMGVAGGALAEEVPIINQFLKTRQAYAPANTAGQASAAVAPNLKKTSALGDTAPPRQAMLPTTAPSDSILPPIPKAARTGIREADLAPMEDLANASYAAQGAKNLGKSVSPEARALGQAANERLGNFEPATAKVAKAPKELEKFAQPESATAKTVRPPKGARARRPANPVQEELPFPAPERAPEPGEWFDQPTTQKLGAEDTLDPGASVSRVEAYGTPQGIRKVIAKPNDGAMPAEWMGIEAPTVANRASAAYKLDQAIPGQKVVPETFERNGVGYQSFVDGTQGSKLDFNEGFGLFSEPSARRIDLNRTISRDLDGHGGNVMWTGLEEGAPQAHAIDNGYAFSGGKFPIKPKRMSQDLPEHGLGFNQFRNELNRTSDKAVAEAMQGLPTDQQRAALARFKELQYNPDATKGLDGHLTGEWLAQAPEARGLSDVDMYHLDKSMGLPASGKLAWKPGTKPSLRQGTNGIDYYQPEPEQLNLLDHAAKREIDEAPVQMQLPGVGDKYHNAARAEHNADVAAIRGDKLPDDLRVARRAWLGQSNNEGNNPLEKLPPELQSAREDWMGSGYREIRDGSADPSRVDTFKRLLASTEKDSPGPLYRGLRLNPQQAAEFKRTGTLPADAAPSSWALDPNDAHNFARPYQEGEIPVVLRQKGGRGSPMSASESEFVLPNHPELKAKSWTKAGPDADEPYMVDVEPHTPAPEQVRTPADPRQMTWADWMKRR